VADKVQLARGAVQEFGLPAVLCALELAKSTWYYHRRGRPSYEEKYASLREPLEAIARELPEYGYRRTQTELRETYGEARNHKVIRRLHGLWDLPLVRGTKAPKPSGVRQAIKTAGARANLVRDLDAIMALEVVYTDFSEIVYAGGRAKAWLIPILDHGSKVTLGWALGAHANSELALKAWDHAVETLSLLGSAPGGCIVHHDQDSVFTGYAWTGRLLLQDGCRISYALNGPGDNPEMESFFGRFKTENRSLLQDAATLAELREVIDQRMAHYNHRRRHSSLGNQAPWTYLESWLSKQ
jgi:transposase InsO family protein